MADMFRKEDAERLLLDKNVLFIGGSNIRAMYKDLVWLLQNNYFVPQELLKRKLEDSHAGDLKVKGSRLHKGRDYIEDRSYHHDKGAHSILVEYSFTSSCYSQSVIEIFNEIKSGDIAPDVVIMNSTLWDINRWGPQGIDKFKENMVKLMKLVSSTLSPSSIFLWLTATPVSSMIRSALLIEEIKFLESIVRYNILEANNYARQIVGSYGYDVLDMHYYCRMQLFYMVKDGIHFEPPLMRYMTNLVLTHCCLSWNKPLPGNIHSNRSLENVKKLASVQDGFTNYIDEENILSNTGKIASNKWPPFLPKRPDLVKVNNAPKQNQICSQNTTSQKSVFAKLFPHKQVLAKQAPSKLQPQRPTTIRPALKPVLSTVDDFQRPTQFEGHSPNTTSQKSIFAKLFPHEQVPAKQAPSKLQPQRPTTIRPALKPVFSRLDNFQRPTQFERSSQNTTSQNSIFAKLFPYEQVPAEQAPSKLQPQRPTTMRPALEPFLSTVDNYQRPTQFEGPSANQNSGPWRPFASWLKANRPNKHSFPPRYAPYQHNRFRGNPRFQNPRMPFWQ